jgi:phospholipid-binding lipoprotein MlaA
MTTGFLKAGLARAAATALVLAAALALAGCATAEKRNPRDPFEPFNRGVSEFNDGLDRVVLRPAASTYRKAVPSLVRTGVSNFFGNLGDVWSAVNSLLQLKVANAFENAMRVHVNTFFGLGGILDLASEFNIERHKEDFGQTLGRWGVPAGPYLVLPFFGPSTLRDAIALPVDRRFDLTQQIDPHSARYGVYTLRALDKRANLLIVSDVLENASLDRYTFTRDAYLQRRRAETTSERDHDPNAGQTDKEPSDGQIPPPPR